MEPLCQNLALKDHCVSMTLLCQIMSCEISLVSGVGVLYTLQQVVTTTSAGLHNEKSQNPHIISGTCVVKCAEELQ